MERPSTSEPSSLSATAPVIRGNWRRSTWPIARRPDAVALVSAAHAYIALRAVEALDDCIRLAGGIGYIARYGCQLIGEHASDGHPDARLAAERLEEAWLWSRALTISGGSAEVIRNILAKRRLRLPSAR